MLQWRALNLCPGNGFASDRYRAIEIERRLMRILGEWEGTPYNTMFAEKRVGVHCSSFVCRVLDELYKRPPTDLPAIPRDIGFHNRAGAIAGLRWFMRQYPTCQQLTDNYVEPGDILIVGPKGGGPGHAMIVGPRENTIWQASEGGVHYTGMALPEIYEFHAAFRFRDRKDWFQC
jgi:hypothetical protein